MRSSRRPASRVTAGRPSNRLSPKAASPPSSPLASATASPGPNPATTPSRTDSAERGTGVSSRSARPTTMAAQAAPSAPSTQPRTAPTLGRSTVSTRTAPTARSSPSTTARTQVLSPAVLTRPSSPGNGRGQQPPPSEMPRVVSHGTGSTRFTYRPPVCTLEVQVRAGGLAAVADLGDLLPRGDHLPGGHEHLVDVPVQGDRAVAVLDGEGETEPTRRAGLEDDASFRRVDRGADRGGDVDTGVERAPADAVTGGDLATGRCDGPSLGGQHVAGGGRLLLRSPGGGRVGGALDREQVDLGLAKLRVESPLLGGDGVEGGLRGGQVLVGSRLGFRSGLRELVAIGDGGAGGLVGAGLLSLHLLELRQRLGPLLAEYLQGGGLLQDLGRAVGVEQERDVAEGVAATHVGLTTDRRDVGLRRVDGGLCPGELRRGGVGLRLGRRESGPRGEGRTAGGLGLEGHPLQRLLRLGDAGGDRLHLSDCRVMGGTRVRDRVRGCGVRGGRAEKDGGEDAGGEGGSPGALRRTAAPAGVRNDGGQYGVVQSRQGDASPVLRDRLPS